MKMSATLTMIKNYKDPKEEKKGSTLPNHISAPKSELGGRVLLGAKMGITL